MQLLDCYLFIISGKKYIALSVMGMHGAVVFQQTQPLFDVPSNWPGVVRGSWLSFY